MSRKRTDDYELNDADISALFKTDLDEPDTALDETILHAARNAQSPDSTSVSRSGFSQWQVALAGCAAVVVLTVVLVPMHMRTSETTVEMSSLDETVVNDGDKSHHKINIEQQAISTVSTVEEEQSVLLSDTVAAGNSRASQSILAQESVPASVPRADIDNEKDSVTDLTGMTAQPSRAEVAKSTAKTLAESHSVSPAAENYLELTSREKIQNNSVGNVQYRSTQLLWITEIKRLYSSNKVEQARDELIQFRLVHPNSQLEDRLPAELKVQDIERNTKEE